MTVKRLKSGKYQVRWRDTDGEQRARNFPTRGLADEFEGHRLRARYLGEAMPQDPAESPTFETFTRRWLDEHAATQKAETTVAEDEATIAKYLIPAFGALRLAELRKTHLLELRAALKGAKGRYNRTLAPKTVNNVLTLAKAMLGVAADWDLVPANPFAGVSLLPVMTQAFDFWTAEERDRFLAACRVVDRPFADLVLVAAHTGLRKGELWALRRSQIDFGQRLIRVDASTSPKIGKRLPRTKNGEVAFVPMNETVLSALKDREHRPGDEPVFNPQLFVDLWARFQRRCKQVGSRPIRFHDLRHTTASTLVMAGVPLYTVQRLMRHKSIAMTERYAHLAPDYLREAAEAICGAPSVHSLRDVSVSNR